MRRSALTRRVEGLEARRQAVQAVQARRKLVHGICNARREVIRCWQRDAHNVMREVPSYLLPDLLIPEKLERVILTNAREIAIYGGRGGAKSITIIDILAAWVHDVGCRAMCLREEQKALKHSVFNGMVKEINRLGIPGYRDVPSQKEIRHDSGGLLTFDGLRQNLTNMKSLYQYLIFWVEESEKTSQESLQVMGPSLRGVSGARIIHTFNVKHSTDPIFLKYVAPYRQALQGGVYEDDFKLIINVGYQDNPWFSLDESLVASLANDKNELATGVMSQQKFDHIWYGAPDDHVENAIITPEMFDAAIDAHLRAGHKFAPTGMRIAAHDPSDSRDAKAIAVRQGSVITWCDETTQGDVHYGCEWAIGHALDRHVDHYTWDCDGIGLALKQQTANAFGAESRVTLAQFRGSETPDNPDAVYLGNNPYQKPYGAVGNRPAEPKTNKEVFKNKRAQYYWALRERFYNTYRAIVLGEVVHPDEMISISSDIPNLPGLRSELTSVPLKPDAGIIQIMSKEQMRRLDIASPNRADAIMMTMRPPPIVNLATPARPQPLRAYGQQRR